MVIFTATYELGPRRTCAPRQVTDPSAQPRLRRLPLHLITPSIQRIIHQLVDRVVGALLAHRIVLEGVKELYHHFHGGPEYPGPILLPFVEAPGLVEALERVELEIRDQSLYEN